MVVYIETLKVKKDSENFCMRSKQVLAVILTHLKNLQFSLKYSIISKYMCPKYISNYECQRSLTEES